MTDNAAGLREQLELATGERISALEGIGERETVAGKAVERGDERADRMPDLEPTIVREPDMEQPMAPEMPSGTPLPAREKPFDMDIDL